MAIFSSSSGTTHHLSRLAAYIQLDEERGSLRWQEKTPDMPGHHYSTGKSIYLFSFPLLLPLPVGFLLAPVGACLGVPPGSGERLPADLADLIALFGPLFLA